MVQGRFGYLVPATHKLMDRKGQHKWGQAINTNPKAIYKAICVHCLIIRYTFRKPAFPKDTFYQMYYSPEGTEIARFKTPKCKPIIKPMSNEQKTEGGNPDNPVQHEISDLEPNPQFLKCRDDSPLGEHTTRPILGQKIRLSLRGHIRERLQKTDEG